MINERPELGLEEAMELVGSLPASKSSSILPLDAFLNYESPPRECIMSPWLRRGSLNMIYAPTGVGKTWFALQVAYSIASGGVAFGRWNCERPCKVLYVDGEMSHHDITERLGLIIGANDKDIPADRMDMLQVLSAEVHERETGRSLPNLYDRDGQLWYEKEFLKVDVVVLDNLGCLWHGGDENKAVDWDQTLTWLRSLRAKGVTVILIHHSGKGGVRKDGAGEIVVQYRGSSRLAEPMDVVLALCRPQDYVMRDGALFECHFYKARSLYGADVSPLQLELREHDGPGSPWIVSAVGATGDRTVELLRNGYSVNQTIEMTGESRATVYRKRQKSRLLGTLSEGAGDPA